MQCKITQICIKHQKYRAKITKNFPVNVISCFSWFSRDIFGDYYMANSSCCSTSFTIFLVRDFGSLLSVSVARFSSAFQLFFFHTLKHEYHHFLIMIILVQFLGVLFDSLYVCTYLNRYQVTKCFISSKIWL